jgi:tight adherence protein B
MNGLHSGIVLFLILCSSIFLSLIAFIVAFLVNKEKIAVEKRLKKIIQKPSSDKYNIKSNEKSRNKSKNKIFNLKITETISNELILANIMMKAEEFIILWMILIFAPGGLVALMSGNPIPSFTLVFLGVIAPPLYIRKQKSKRLISFENQLGDALVIVSNCLRSGITFQQAMENISVEMPDPISREFARVIREIKYGSSIEKALTNLGERIKSQDLMLTISAILIQRQVGGNLAEVLDNISETIKERLKIKDEIRVLTATGRMSGTVIGMLPVAIGLILLLLNPDYIKMFFGSPIGTFMLVVAAILEGSGFIVVKKIVSVKY